MFYIRAAWIQNLTFSSHYSASSELACSSAAKPHSASCFHLSLICRLPVRLCRCESPHDYQIRKNREPAELIYDDFTKPQIMFYYTILLSWRKPGRGRPSETAADKWGNNKDGRTRCDFNEVLYPADFFSNRGKNLKRVKRFFTPAALKFTKLTLGDNVGK